jgi:two-component system cell cycle sensor histidine kinase/response regulator CckA
MENPLILIIDDEVAILTLLREVLGINNFKTETFESFDNVPQFYKENQDAIKAIILDMQLLGVDYRTTLPALFELNPQMKIIAMSGAVTLEDIPSDLRTKIQCMLPKPFKIDTLIKELKKILPAN